MITNAVFLVCGAKNSDPKKGPNSNHSTPVTMRRDAPRNETKVSVPPSPDTIKGSKTLQRLQNNLRERDAKEKPSRY